MLKLVTHFLSLFYPDICAACNTGLAEGEKHICVTCQIELPKTNFHTDEENPVVKNFWGRVPVTMASSYYYFNKGSNVQRLLHSLKYKGNKHVGETIGRLYGAELKSTAIYSGVDYIVPVPIHKKKERTRGYNQSEYFGKGLAEGLGTAINTNNLVKAVSTKSQTKKTRLERIENVKNSFTVKNPAQFEGKHILLVDDVITTGATLEECALTLAQIPNIKISIASIAYAP